MFGFIKTWYKDKKAREELQLHHDQINSEYERLESYSKAVNSKYYGPDDDRSSTKFLIRAIEFSKIHNVDLTKIIDNIIKRLYEDMRSCANSESHFDAESYSNVKLNYDEIIKMIPSYQNCDYFKNIDAFNTLYDRINKRLISYNDYIIAVKNEDFKSAAEIAVKSNWFHVAFEMYKKAGDIDNAYKCKVIIMEKE